MVKPNFSKMRRYLVFLVWLTSSGIAQGAISRGGFGLLYPDSNSLNNLGHTATNAGFAGEVLFAKYTGTHELVLSPSVSWSSGKLAVAAYGSRYGMNLSDSSLYEEAFGVGLGTAFGGGSWTLGVALDRTVDVHRSIARNGAYSTFTATLGLHTSSSVGFAVSLGSTVDRPGSQAARLAAGFGAKVSPTWHLEAVGAFPDMTDTGNAELGGFATWQGSRVYVSGGANYLTRLTAPQTLFRIGVVFGAVDVSAFFTYVLKDAENPFHGAALRVAL